MFVIIVDIHKFIDHCLFPLDPSSSLLFFFLFSLSANFVSYWNVFTVFFCLEIEFALKHMDAATILGFLESSYLSIPLPPPLFNEGQQQLPNTAKVV